MPFKGTVQKPLYLLIQLNSKDMACGFIVTTNSKEWISYAYLFVQKFGGGDENRVFAVV